MKITLRAARVNRGWGLKKAAEMLKICERTLWSWEKGLTFPSTKKADEIAKTYGINKDNIIFLPIEHD